MKGITPVEFVQYCQAIVDAELERAKKEFPPDARDGVELIGPLGLIAKKLSSVKHKKIKK